MSPKVRDSIYLALAVLNAALEAMTRQDVLPAQYAHYVALASILVAAMLPKFLSPPMVPAAPECLAISRN